MFANLMCGLVHFVSDGPKCSCAHEPHVTSKSERQPQHNADSVIRVLSANENMQASFFLSFFYGSRDTGRG